MSGVKKLYILPVGEIENDIAWNLAGVNAASKSNPARPAQWITVPCLAYLIEHETLGWVLFDTGFRPDDPQKLSAYAREYFPGRVAPDSTMAAHLKRLGLKPSDIGRIVVSHMHWDHGGGLELFSGTPAGRKVMAAERDYAYGLTVTHRDADVDFGGGGYFKGHFEVPGIAFDLVSPEQGDFNLADGIRVVQLEGHTPQMLGLLVDLPVSGRFLIVSDAIYMKRNFEPVPIPPGIIYDSLGFNRSVRKAAQIVSEYSARIVYPHDPDQMSSIKVAPNYYE